MPAASVPRPAAARKANERGSPEIPASTPSFLYQKTKMCKFNAAGRCKRGAGCFFAHSGEELKDLPDLAFTRICPSVRAGRQCTDPACTYAHRRADLRAPVKGKKPAALSHNADSGETPIAATIADASSGLCERHTTPTLPHWPPSMVDKPEDESVGHPQVQLATEVMLVLLPLPQAPTPATSSVHPAIVPVALVPQCPVPQPEQRPRQLALDAVATAPNAAKFTPLSPQATAEPELDFDDGHFSQDSHSWDGSLGDSANEPDWQGNNDWKSEGLDFGYTSSFAVDSGSQKVAVADACSSGEATHEVDIITRNTFVELVPRAGGESAGLRRSISGFF